MLRLEQEGKQRAEIKRRRRMRLGSEGVQQHLNQPVEIQQSHLKTVNHQDNE